MSQIIRQLSRKIISPQLYNKQWVQGQKYLSYSNNCIADKNYFSQASHLEQSSSVRSKTYFNFEQIIN